MSNVRTRSVPDRSIRVLAVALLMIATSVTLSACARPDRTPTDGRKTTAPSMCQASTDQEHMLGVFRKIGTWPWPSSVKPVRVTELVGSCTTTWPDFYPEVTSVKHEAGVEYEFAIDHELTVAEMESMINERATQDGWRENGSADGLDHVSFVRYCGQFDGVWATMTLLRKPAVDDKSLLRMFAESHPKASKCPGRPTDG
jgi:hypothetical protein